MENYTAPSTNSTYNFSANPLTTVKTMSRPKSPTSTWYETGKVQIPLYSIIFMLAVVGNTLVILTLVRNRRMRTITNLFLLNLAVSDLLLGVLCMPFTLIGALLRDFVFGEVMCKLVPFLQACSVSVGAWTLVAISVERYYAICHPLRSLRWQTSSHAYKLIAAIWIGSLICMSPIALLSQLKPTKQGNHKCRESWYSKRQERAYNIFLDVILLLIPLLVMLTTYSLIARTLYKGMKSERALRDSYVNGDMEVFIQQKTAKTTTISRRNSSVQSSFRQFPQNSTSSTRNTKTFLRHLTLRRTNADRSLHNKKRVIKMLFAVVLEFFICWTPLYIINTVALFDPFIIYNGLGYTAISFFQLLAYTSSCCNPITYCFMNRAFRKTFVNIFGCLGKYNNDLAGSDINMVTKWVHKFPEPNT
ncbi:cholecystokinin receptor-like isoform X1 [Coccinella septempunctata]|uniref:cholecystokinin receptor-like isoform X1 n=2 Tax=Coccinella septempunctata TaxID=41139 RepID=UPI001D099A8B|nr:cholecystokinin receptor-like isoform X1 [Coccinella septempunctata]